MKILDEMLFKSRPHERVYEVRYGVEYKVGDDLLEVPAGFKTDGASIPRFAWVTTGTPYAPEHIRAATVHDHLYQTGLADRKEADLLFYAALKADGVGEYQAVKMYFALRLFGWIAWRRYRKLDRRITELVVGDDEEER